MPRAVSGDVDLTGAAADGDLTAGSVSGSITREGTESARAGLGTVSGDVVLTDVTCERLAVKSVSGNVEFSGTLAQERPVRNQFAFRDVRLMLADSTGFELNANSFSGSIRSDLPLTIGGDRARRTGDRARRDDNAHNMRAHVRRRQRRR